MRTLLTIVVCTALWSPLVAEQPSASVRVAIMVADAEELYRVGKKRQAVKLYDRASAIAFQEGASGRAFELSRTAAAILESLGERTDAGGRLRRLAMSNPQHPDAAQAHIDALVCLASNAGSSRQLTASYGEALQEFLDNWPTHPYAGETRYQLAQSKYLLDEHDQAIHLLSGFTSKDTRYEQAIDLLGATYVKKIARINSQEGTPAQIKQVVLRATKQLQPVITGADNQWPEQWTSMQRQAAYHLAVIHDCLPGSRHAYPRRILEAASKGSPAPADDWAAKALPRLIVALIADEQYAKAADWCSRLPSSADQGMRPLAERLVSYAWYQPDHPFGRQLLAAIASRFADDASSEWANRCLGASLLLENKYAEATKVLEPLHSKSPRDIPLKLLLGQSLAGAASEEQYDKADALFREIESSEPHDSTLHYVARLSRIELLIQRGDRNAAAKLLDLTRVLLPRPKQGPLLTRLERLESRVAPQKRP